MTTDGYNTTSDGLEYGLVYADERGHIHTSWGYTVSPLDQIDKGGTIQLDKHNWGTAYEILVRPKTTETVLWRSGACPWAEFVGRRPR